MCDLCKLFWWALLGLFRSLASLQAEIMVLRHQMNVLRRRSPKRAMFGNIDRLVFVGLYALAPGVLDALKILKPGTNPLASRGFSRLLALEVPTTRRPPEYGG